MRIERCSGITILFVVLVGVLTIPAAAGFTQSAAPPESPAFGDPQQLAWLEKELANAGSDWKICYFHHPWYSSGAFHSSSTELRMVLEPLFLKHEVQVVFAGHEHVYERVKSQKGIYYVTEGASGELRAGNPRKTDLTAGVRQGPLVPVG